jgi:hypothetical protein
MTVPAPASNRISTNCTCGHRGKFRLDRTGRSSAQCRTCGGWQSTSTILAYASIRQSRQRRTLGRATAVVAVLLVGLVATTFAGEVLERMGTPIDPAPRVLARSA